MSTKHVFEVDQLMKYPVIFVNKAIDTKTSNLTPSCYTAGSWERSDKNLSHFFHRSSPNFLLVLDRAYLARLLGFAQKTEAYIPELPIGHDGNAVSQDVCLVHVMRGEKHSAA